jgi:transcription factor E2F3
MTRDPNYAEHAYATFDDIRSLNNLTENENETLLAIRAPPGTSLEVPDPDSLPPEEKERYQVYLTSWTGEILVYVVSNGMPNTGEEPRVYSTNSCNISQNVVEEMIQQNQRQIAEDHEGLADLFSF